MLIQYITKGKRDVENRPTDIKESGIWGQRKGAMVGFININKETDRSEIYIGFSLKNKKEWDWGLQFDKNLALQKAIGKAYSLSPIVVVSSGDIKYNGDEILWVKEVIEEIPQSIRHDVFKFIDRCKRYYKDVDLTAFWKNMDIILQEKFLFKALGGKINNA